MKKTVIALAVASALPVAAQADVMLSGSVSAEYTLGSDLVPVTEAKLSASSSEVLANGITVTADFSVLGNGNGITSKDQGTVGLSGDFGSFTGGTSAIERETEDADGEDVYESVNGISYTGSFADMSVNATVGTWDENSDAGEEGDMLNDGIDPDPEELVTYGASYDFNGLIISGQYTSETTFAGFATEATEMSASYTFGELTISGSKSTGADVIVTAAYVADMGDLAVSVEADSDNEWQMEATYTMGNLAVTAKDDQEDGGSEVSAKYAAGDLSLEVDSDSTVIVAYNMGNADLSMTREDDSTKVKYIVSF
jgi:predicted porin